MATNGDYYCCPIAGRKSESKHSFTVHSKDISTACSHDAFPFVHSTTGRPMVCSPEFGNCPYGFDCVYNKAYAQNYCCSARADLVIVFSSSLPSFHLQASTTRLPLVQETTSTFPPTPTPTTTVPTITITSTLPTLPSTTTSSPPTTLTTVEAPVVGTDERPAPTQIHKGWSLLKRFYITPSRHALHRWYRTLCGAVDAHCAHL